MSEKAKDYFDFIDDADAERSKNLWNRMVSFAKQPKMNAKKLTDKFKEEGYDGVSERDSRTILKILQRGKTHSGEMEDWGY